MTASWVPERLRLALGALRAGCSDEPTVVAAWVGGSLARDTADEWSDIDLHLLVVDAAAFSREVVGWFARALQVAHADSIPGVPGGFLFITPEWVHVDVILHDRRGFEQSDHPARVLLDPQGLIRQVTALPDEMQGEPYLPDGQPELFLYFMGTVVVAVRRQEWLALAQGAAGFRDSLLIPLMLGESGVRKTDGAKRLNRYLTADQIKAIEAIPPIGSEPESLIRAHEAIAREFLGRARRLRDRLDTPWPRDLERASVELWRRELGLDLG